MNNSKKLTELAQQCASITKEKGFFEVWNGNEIGLLKHNVLQQYGELAEAYEAKRKGKFYNGTFEKDTFEDELADVCIFGLSCLGYFNNYLIEYPDHELKENQSIFFEVEFTELYLNMLDNYSPSKFTYTLAYLSMINSIIVNLIFWCECKGIDIFMHIDQKMQYNASREKLHGKKF